MGVERERESRMGGEARRARSGLGVHPDLSDGTKMLGKMPLTKKAHEKSLKSIEQSLLAGPNCQAGWEKVVQPRFWVKRGFYRRGRLRKLVHAW
jgi:hypothetical protein